MAQFTVLKQEELETINAINRMKINDAYVVLNEYNGYSTICQYSQKYDNFHIVSVKTENLDPKVKMN